MAKALVVAETFAGKTTAVKVSPSTTPASRRVFSKSKHSPLDDKSPWCHTIKIFIKDFDCVILLMEEILHHLGCIKPCK